MTTTYEIILAKDILERGAPIPDYCDPEDFTEEHFKESWFDSGYDAYVYRCEDGVPVEYLGSDGGEPEDQTLGRAWSWVVPALQAAYDRGYESGSYDRGYEDGRTDGAV